MRFLLLNILILLRLTSYSQDHPGSLERLAFTKIFIEPSSLIDIYNGPCIRLGADVPLSLKTSAIGVAGDYGQGYYLKGGIKRYGIIKNEPELYWAISAFLKNNTEGVSDNLNVYDSAGNNKPGHSVDYNIIKHVWGVHIEIGEAIYGRHLFFEWYMGLGIRVRTATLSIPDSVQWGYYHHFESIIDHFTNGSSSNQVLPSITGGIRVGYFFRNTDKKVTRRRTYKE